MDTLLRNRLKADGNYGRIDMVQFPGGYATIDGSDVTFHYYTQDYLGNKNFNANSIELGKPNPSNPKTTKARGINIHLPGENNITGKTRSGDPISMGCLLIDRKKWNDFIKTFNNPEQVNSVIGIIIDR